LFHISRPIFDHYKTLGVDKNADDKAVKQAFFKMAKKYHPDQNPDDKDSETKFKEINEAYQVLSDKNKRAEYDMFGSASNGMNGGGFPGGAQGFENMNVQNSRHYYRDYSDSHFYDFYDFDLDEENFDFHQRSRRKRKNKFNEDHFYEEHFHTFSDMWDQGYEPDEAEGQIPKKKGKNKKRGYDSDHFYEQYNRKSRGVEPDDPFFFWEEPPEAFWQGEDDFERGKHRKKRNRKQYEDSDFWQEEDEEFDPRKYSKKRNRMREKAEGHFKQDHEEYYNEKQKKAYNREEQKRILGEIVWRKKKFKLKKIDIQMDISLTFEDAFKENKRDIRLSVEEKCGTCKGSGQKVGTSPQKCMHCNGSGMISRQTGFMIMQSSCPYCSGEGYSIDPCTTCDGSGLQFEQKTVAVTIPAGVEDGMRVRIPHQGSASRGNGARGHLYLMCGVKPSKKFERIKSDLHVQIVIPLSMALLGGSVDIPLPNGKTVAQKVAPGTQSGHKETMRGKGFPDPRTGMNGHLHIHINVHIPTGLDEESKKLMEQFKEQELFREPRIEKPNVDNERKAQGQQRYGFRGFG